VVALKPALKSVLKRRFMRAFPQRAPGPDRLRRLAAGFVA